MSKGKKAKSENWSPPGKGFSQYDWSPPGKGSRQYDWGPPGKGFRQYDAKGSGKGPRFDGARTPGWFPGECYNCGEQGHRASECKRQSGKAWGKGKNMNTLENESDASPQPSAEGVDAFPIWSVSQVWRPRTSTTLGDYLPMKNRYGALASDACEEQPVSLLERVEVDDRGVFHVGTQENEENVVEGIVDSGAAESVAPASISAEPAVADPATAHQCYITADWTSVFNQGAKTVIGTPKEGQRLCMKYQIANVTKPLMSVSKICDKGNVVIVEASGGYIKHLVSGRRTGFERRGGVYVLPTTVAGEQGGFVRPGSRKWGCLQVP